MADLEPANGKIPPPSWNARLITFSVLASAHPTSKGICCDLQGRLRSIQMVVPNNYYNDTWFEEDILHYKPSLTDKAGNAALERAYILGQEFRLFCYYKKGMDNKLQQLGIDARYAGKGYDLGTVRIIGKENEDYKIVKVVNNHNKN
jgi:hypothetical protein